MLQIRECNKVFTMFLVESIQHRFKFDVYMDTEKGYVFYNTVVGYINGFGCAENEVIAMLPKREEYFINILSKEGVLIKTDKYNEGKFEKQPIYSIDFEKAKNIGLNLISEQTAIEWKIERQNDRR